MSSVDSILKQIIKRAQQIQSLTHPSVSTSSDSLALQTYSPRPLVNISLPDPPPIRPALLAAGARPEISLAIDQAYQKRAADLKAAYPSDFRHGHDQKVLSVFIELYLKQLVTWREEGVASYLKHSSAGDKTPQHALRVVWRSSIMNMFHCSNTSSRITHFHRMLIRLFPCKEINNDVSSDSCLGMHIYCHTLVLDVDNPKFQNRRNRMKKEGQAYGEIYYTEEKKAPTSPSTPPHSPTRQGGEMMSIASKRCNPLEPLAPLHAFPSSYPPSCSYNPFPSKNGVTNFGAPKWPRRPMTATVQCHILDIDGLIDRFSRINILDDSGSCSRGSVDSYAAVAAITVVPLPAPLPALIRGTATRITPVRVPLLSVPATASRRHVFDTPSPQSRPITLVPASETPRGQKIRHRKMAPLPKHIPHRNPVCYRGVMPAVSEASVTSPSPSSPSCSSSFGFESSSQNRLFSSASSTSSSSSGIMTPSPFPSPSTQLASPPNSLYNFSSSITDLFGDALESVPSPAEGLQLDFNSSLFGNEQILKSAAFDFSFGMAPAVNLVSAPP
ncbi:homeodomain protein 2 [Suillus bovinus]|uniref:homeodomain protein 2 n=1 Tax=Suillus bovinus TaxID=48563 RepID=UPI001B88306E|nr:homeodomain protein 2 [Suillus bovinus]KAG2156649.1 homeodomain protein 2 [Suillus bovinus]